MPRKRRPSRLEEPYETYPTLNPQVSRPTIPVPNSKKGAKSFNMQSEAASVLKDLMRDASGSGIPTPGKDETRTGSRHKCKPCKDRKHDKCRGFVQLAHGLGKRECSCVVCKKKKGEWKRYRPFGKGAM